GQRGGDLVPAGDGEPAEGQRPAHRPAGGGGGPVPDRAPAGGAAAGPGGGDGVVRDHPPPRPPAVAGRATRARGPAHGGGRGLPRGPQQAWIALKGSLKSQLQRRSIRCLTGVTWYR